MFVFFILLTMYMHRSCLLCILPPMLCINIGCIPRSFKNSVLLNGLVDNTEARCTHTHSRTHLHTHLYALNTHNAHSQIMPSLHTHLACYQMILKSSVIFIFRFQDIFHTFAASCASCTQSKLRRQELYEDLKNLLFYNNFYLELSYY